MLIESKALNMIIKTVDGGKNEDIQLFFLRGMR